MPITGNSSDLSLVDLVQANVLVRNSCRITVAGAAGSGVLFLADLDEVSSLVAHLEPDQKGVPVLLRQYLKLGARVLGLNVDPEFSNVLDALVLVDLTRAEPRVLGRYLGPDGAHSFLAHHSPRGTAPQALVS